MNFILPLTEERVKPEHKITLHLFVVFVLIATGAFLLLLQYLLQGISILHNDQLKQLHVPSGLGIIVLLSSFFLLGMTLFKSKWLLQASINKWFRIIEGIIMMALSVAAFTTQLTMPSVLFGLLALVLFFAFFGENGKSNQLIIEVAELGIKFPVTARKKGLAWWEVEQILLRFGTITINCHDNRLYQWQLGKIDFDIAIFEQFCSIQIEAHREDRKKYVW
jgi:hypothetical protein